MRVFSSCIYTQVSELPAAQWPARKHALDSLLDNTLRMIARKYLTFAATFNTSRVSCVPVENVLLRLVAGKTDFLGIDYNNVIAAIDMRGKLRLFLAAKTYCNK